MQEPVQVHSVCVGIPPEHQNQPLMVPVQDLGHPRRADEAEELVRVDLQTVGHNVLGQHLSQHLRQGVCTANILLLQEGHADQPLDVLGRAHSFVVHLCGILVIVADGHAVALHLGLVEDVLDRLTADAVAAGELGILEQLPKRVLAHQHVSVGGGAGVVFEGLPYGGAELRQHFLQHSDLHRRALCVLGEDVPLQAEEVQLVVRAADLLGLHVRHHIPGQGPMDEDGAGQPLRLFVHVQHEVHPLPVGPGVQPQLRAPGLGDAVLDGVAQIAEALEEQGHDRDMCRVGGGPCREVVVRRRHWQLQVPDQVPYAKRLLREVLTLHHALRVLRAQELGCQHAEDAHIRVQQRRPVAPVLQVEVGGHLQGRDTVHAVGPLQQRRGDDVAGAQELVRLVSDLLGVCVLHRVQVLQHRLQDLLQLAALGLKGLGRHEGRGCVLDGHVPHRMCGLGALGLTGQDLLRLSQLQLSVRQLPVEVSHHHLQPVDV
mmetsp:Transcript_115002/g.200088  ORF Transcript_115002/g.200088 Transcript_115002/m.200088 type:complete len:487 (-) Transcript_115002:788-2248(-)